MTQCFAKVQNETVLQGSWTKCPDSNNCCDHGDLCLGSNLCWSPQNNTRIDYYVAGCTDENWKDSACVNWCADQRAPSLVQWQNGTNWACCGSNNLGQPSCSQKTETFTAPPQSTFDSEINHVYHLATGILVAIIIACVVLAAAVLFCAWRCCCSRAARDKRARGKFVPLGAGRDGSGYPGGGMGMGGGPGAVYNQQQQDSVVWNANVHDAHELQDGPMGGYASAPHAPGERPPQYTVANFR